MVEGYFSKLLESTKVLQLPQILFLLLSYYLLANSIYIALTKVVTLNLPKVITENNTQILEFLQDWSIEVLLLGLLLLFIGMINTLLGFLPKLEEYIVFKNFAGVGWFIGIWLVAAFLIYYTYSLLQGTFFLVYTVIVFVVAIIYQKKK